MFTLDDRKLTLLANLMRVRKENNNTYIVLLGSGLSITPSVLHDLGCDTLTDFYTMVQPLSNEERYSLLQSSIHVQNFKTGYRCLAELTRAGYFDLILTANPDPSIYNALVSSGLASEDIELLVHGKDRVEQIVSALRRQTPRKKVVMLRGSLQSRVIPLTPVETLQFDSRIATLLEEYLTNDMIVIGTNERDMDIYRCIRVTGGAIWYAVPQPIASDDYIYHIQLARQSGGIIGGKYADFNQFFCTLAQMLGLQGTKNIAPSLVTEDEGFIHPQGEARKKLLIEIEHQETILAELVKTRHILEKIVAEQGVANIDIVIKLERTKEQEKEHETLLTTLHQQLSSLYMEK